MIKGRNSIAANFQRADGLFENIRLQLIPVDIDLDGERMFEVNISKALLTKIFC